MGRFVCADHPTARVHRDAHSVCTRRWSHTRFGSTVDLGRGVGGVREEEKGEEGKEGGRMKRRRRGKKRRRRRRWGRLGRRTEE